MVRSRLPVNNPSANVPLKITLVDSEPEVWRQVLVSAEITLADLHDVIQRSMGWENLHDYSFQIGLGTEKSAIDTDRTLLELLSNAGSQPIYYNYDAENGWRHRLAAQPLEVLDVDSQKLPVCTAGAAACPPERSGGIWGYDQLLARLEDFEDPDYIELLDRYGDFDPNAFDLDAANARLAD